MKTFETEKHNIPDGATHYADECEDYQFTWFSELDDGGVYLFSSPEKGWVLSRLDRELKKIPQQEVEWKNGDKCLYLNERECIFIGMRMNSKTHCIVETKSNSTYMPVNIKELSKPESPEEKEKRERLEAAYDLYVTAQESLDVIGYQDFDDFASDLMQVKFYNSIVDKTNYRVKTN